MNYPKFRINSIIIIIINRGQKGVENGVGVMPAAVVTMVTKMGEDGKWLFGWRCRCWREEEEDVEEWEK